MKRSLIAKEKNFSRAHASLFIYVSSGALYPLCILYISYAVFEPPLPSPTSKRPRLPNVPTLLLGNVVLLLEQVTLDLGVLELLEVSICIRKSAKC